jgi:zinc protease
MTIENQMNYLKKSVKKYLQIFIAGVACNLLIANFATAALPITKIDLDTGAKLYFVEVKSIPMVDIGIDFQAGSVYDPANKSGVADLVASLMNKGALIRGQKKTEAFIADQISDRGASVGFAAGAESSSLRIRSLSRQDVLNGLIDHVADMLAFPTFDSNILQREKQREISALKEANAKPEVMLSKQFSKMIYGNHPLGTETTEKSVMNIQMGDLKQFHQTYYRAANANVLIVGDVTREQAIQIGNRLTERLSEKSSQALNQKKAVNLQIPEVPPLTAQSAEKREVRLSHPSQQAHVRMGALGVPRNDPDYFPLMVGNYVLGGGGFVSRLMMEIREKRGLSYGVSSYFYPLKNSGLFIAGLQTKKDQANQALEVMRQTVGEFIQHGPTASEMTAAKDNLINGFPLRIDSNKKILDNLSGIAWHGLPLNTLDEWTNQVRAVTDEQVKKAFQKHLHMDQMVTVVVGAQ